MENELNLLLRRNNDGFKGYTLASESIENDNFKNFLQAYARQRKHYAEELKSEIERLGLKVKDTTSMLGDIHESILKLKKSVSTLSDESILRECARGEDQAVSDYEKVLKSNTLPPEVQKVVMRQRDKIRAAGQTLTKLSTVI